MYISYNIIFAKYKCCKYYRDKSSVSYFTPDLCRTIFFNYKEETEVQGISGYKYWLDTGFIGIIQLKPVEIEMETS